MGGEALVPLTPDSGAKGRAFAQLPAMPSPEREAATSTAPELTSPTSPQEVAALVPPPPSPLVPPSSPADSPEPAPQTEISSIKQPVATILKSYEAKAGEPSELGSPVARELNGYLRLPQGGEEKWPWLPEAKLNEQRSDLDRVLKHREDVQSKGSELVEVADLLLYKCSITVAGNNTPAANLEPGQGSAAVDILERLPRLLTAATPALMAFGVDIGGLDDKKIAYLAMRLGGVAKLEEVYESLRVIVSVKDPGPETSQSQIDNAVRDARKVFGDLLWCDRELKGENARAGDSRTAGAASEGGSGGGSTTTAAATGSSGGSGPSQQGGNPETQQQGEPPPAGPGPHNAQPPPPVEAIFKVDDRGTRTLFEPTEEVLYPGDSVSTVLLSYLKHRLEGRGGTFLPQAVTASQVGSLSSLITNILRDSDSEPSPQLRDVQMPDSPEGLSQLLGDQGFLVVSLPFPEAQGKLDLASGGYVEAILFPEDLKQFEEGWRVKLESTTKDGEGFTALVSWEQFKKANLLTVAQ